MEPKSITACVIGLDDDNKKLRAELAQLRAELHRIKNIVREWQFLVAEAMGIPHPPECTADEIKRMIADRDEWKRRYEEEYRDNPKRAGVHDVSQYYKPEDDDASAALERARGMHQAEGRGK